jgi:hypothetical protein
VPHRQALRKEPGDLVSAAACRAEAATLSMLAITAATPLRGSLPSVAAFGLPIAEAAMWPCGSSSGKAEARASGEAAVLDRWIHAEACVPAA